MPVTKDNLVGACLRTGEPPEWRWSGEDRS